MVCLSLCVRVCACACVCVCVCVHEYCYEIPHYESVIFFFCLSTGPIILTTERSLFSDVLTPDIFDTDSLFHILVCF